MAPVSWEGRLLVVGAGLMGTSLGLAVTRVGGQVLLADLDARRSDLAASLGAGEALPDGLDSDSTILDGVDLVVVAAPPAAVGTVAAAAIRSCVRATVTHLASVQSRPQRDIESLGVSTARFVGSHPIAGREHSGPVHADADLFRDRPWVIAPTDQTEPDAVRAVVELARVCGGRPVQLDARAHDELFARLSHVPQLVASALAGALQGLPPDDVALAGAGIRDTTRLADSDPEMWAQIVDANAEPVAAGLRAVLEPLTALAERLERAGRDGDRVEVVRGLVERGRRGRALLPGKHGGAPTALSAVEVVVPDEPGALARLLAAVAAEEVNLEDLRVDHSQGQPVGVAELAVAPTAADRLVAALRSDGWTVSSGSDTAL